MANARDINWLKDSYNLIYYYKRDDETRERVDETFAYNNRSVFFYVETLIRFSPNYFRYYRQVFQRDLSYFYNRKVRQIWKDILPIRLWSFLDKCEADRVEYNRLRNVISFTAPYPSLYSSREMRALTAADNLGSPLKKINEFNKLLQNITKTIGAMGRGIQLKEPATKEESPYEWFIKELEKKPPYLTPKEQLATLQREEKEEEKPDNLTQFRNIMGGAENPQKVSRELPSLQPRPQLPSFARGGISQAQRGTAALARGAGSAALRLGNFAVGAGLRGAAALAAGAGVSVGAPLIVAFIVVLGIIFILPIIFNLFQSSSFFPPFEQKMARAGPENFTGGGDIAQCKFTRGDRRPPEASFKSGRLLGYFQEAYQITSVPAVILAAISRVETPGSSDWTDESLGSICPRSPTGALGLMQLQPEGTRGHFPTGIAAGAGFLNKTPSSLTEADYCNPRTNIILGAGFILKKMQALGFGDGTQWSQQWLNDRNAINTLARGFYGCLEYGGGDPLRCSGPYNYGDDLWRSIQACQASPAPNQATNLVASCPVVGGTIDTHSYQEDNQRGHCSGSYGYSCRCGTLGRRAKAIDIHSVGKNVVLPKISGQDVMWRMITEPYNINDSEGGGLGYTFKTTLLSGDRWYLDMLHLNRSGLQYNTDYPSGTVVATTIINHVHATIGKNLSGDPVAGTNTDCDANWLSSDFMCK